MTALGKAMADLEVADPEQQRVQEVKKRVRRKSKDLEDMMMELNQHIDDQDDGSAHPTSIKNKAKMFRSR